MQATLPDTLSPAVRAALADAREALYELYGARLRQVVLFGSHARGEAHDESDVDVLVVLDGEVDYVTEARRVLDVQIDMLNRYELLLSLIPVALATYQDVGHPLMINVYDEGITL